MPVLNATVVYQESRQKELLILSPAIDPALTAATRGSLEYAQRSIRVGQFFSKTSSEVGDWIYDDGVLRLRWERSARTLEFVQKSLMLENEWRCEAMATSLKFTNLSGSPFLPNWMVPKDPEEMMKELTKRSKQREMRTLIEEGKARAEIAAEFSECAICFFELHLFPVAILRYQSKRSCAHYFHYTCATEYKARLETRHEHIGCPICHKRFTEVKALPDLLEDPRMWFQLCDTDLTGSLDKHEVLEGLLAVLPVERARLEKSINGSWQQWDSSGDGSIELNEFIDPQNGLKTFLMKNYNIFKKDADVNQQLRSIPSLDIDPHRWFQFWDYNQSGTLERIELARALIKTYCVTSWGDPVIQRASDMYQLTLSVWDLMGYKSRDKLDFEEFIRPFGIADQVVHNVTHGQFFGEDDEHE